MKRVVLFLILISLPVAAQYNGKNWSISINAVYTTTARLYLNPNSADLLLRNNYFSLEGITGPQLEIRFKFMDDIFLGLSTEYMKNTSTGQNLTAFSGGRTVSILLEDGFLLIPIEFSGYYLLPFSTESFKFLMGGGVGYYLGSHIRKFGDVEVSNVKRENAFGIHVIVSMDYLITNYLSTKIEMKFRDPQFDVTSRYNKTNVNYNGRVIQLSQQEFDSRINVNGISFIFGLSLQF